MAGRRSKAPQAPKRRSLVASSVRYPGKAARIYMGSKSWQQEAYRHYAICGEARYAANYFGHSMSKATLHATEMTAEGEKQVAAGSPAATILDDLFNGREGKDAMLKAFGVHLTIAGECYLIGRAISQQERDDYPLTSMETDVWEVVSVTEVMVAGGNWSLRYRDDRPPIDLSDEDVVIRIWSPDPEKRSEADSPFKSMLPVLSEIEWLTKHIFAQTSSRLTGAGILFLPQSMNFPPPPDQDGEPVETTNDADAFMLTLADSMMASIGNDESPARMVPITVTVPDDVVDKAKLMHFWSDLDEKALEMRNDAIVRFARGMDLPAEKVLGISSNTGSGGGTSNGVSHWGAWQIDEDSITLHIEPMLSLVANALTISYLRPLTGNMERVRFDTVKLRVRPDRSKEAIMLWDREVITTKAMVREVGFNDDDILDVDSDEYRQRILRKIASGSATPDQVAAANRALGIDLPDPASEEYRQATREARPAPSLLDKPTRDLPEQDIAARLILAVSEPLVLRALERCGNRLRTAGARPPGAPAFATHVYVQGKDPDYLLEDAWTTAPIVFDGIASAEAIVPVLDAYCRSLINERAEHSRDRLQQWIGLAVPA